MELANTNTVINSQLLSQYFIPVSDVVEYIAVTYFCRMSLFTVFYYVDRISYFTIGDGTYVLGKSKVL